MIRSPAHGGLSTRRHLARTTFRIAVLATRAVVERVVVMGGP